MVNHGSRTVLVTGCSSGIGRETALQLHRARQSGGLFIIGCSATESFGAMIGRWPSPSA